MPNNEFPEIEGWNWQLNIAAAAEFDNLLISSLCSELVTGGFFVM